MFAIIKISKKKNVKHEFTIKLFKDIDILKHINKILL